MVDDIRSDGGGIELWLIRHGETDWNSALRFQGWTDVELNDRGRSQAAVLAGLLDGVDFDSVWSSDLTRAVETATIVAGQEPIRDARLRELDFGRMEGSRWDQLDAATQAALREFDGFAAPDGESMADLEARVVEFLSGLPAGRHLLVSHGGVIRLLLRMCGSEGFPGHEDVTRVEWGARRRIE